jgi:hypothetical protein
LAEKRVLYGSGPARHAARNALFVIDILLFIGAVLTAFRLRSTYNFGLFITQAPVK